MTARDWTDWILGRFPSDTGRGLFLQEDPDRLFADEGLFVALSARGCRVEVFSSTLSLRHAYENWLLPSDDARLILLFRNGEDLGRVVPPDILRWEWTRTMPPLSMDAIFPDLDASVLREVDRGLVPLLFQKREEAKRRGGGEEATCEFVFEDIMGISATSVLDVPGLLERLAEIHVEREITSPRLLAYFRRCIRNKAAFKELRRDGGILTDAAAFRAWASHAWRTVFLGRSAQDPPPDAAFAGKVDFGDRRVRAVVRRLFRAGAIAMCGGVGEMARQYEYLAPRRGGAAEALGDMLGEIDDGIPAADGAGWSDWTRFARDWAEFTGLADVEGVEVTGRGKVCARVDEAFAEWLSRNYAALPAMPAQTPLIPYRVMDTVAAARHGGINGKVALIVMDGMAWNQWIPVRRRLEDRFRISEQGMFSCVPTLTSVSRQAIFAGKPPLAFAHSIGSTSDEKKLLKEAWRAHGGDPARIFYAKGLGMGDPAEDVVGHVYTGVDLACLVIDTVDAFSHGTLMGNREMHVRIAEWLGGDYLGRLLAGLVDELGFTVFITSDHGNVECRGTGTLKNKSLAETRGARTLVYDNDILRDDAIAQCPEARIWNGDDLPADFRPIVQAGRGAFAPQGEVVVAHGGISLEEVVVPFVKVERKVR